MSSKFVLSLLLALVPTLVLLGCVDPPPERTAAVAVDAVTSASGIVGTALPLFGNSWMTDGGAQSFDVNNRVIAFASGPLNVTATVPVGQSVASVSFVVRDNAGSSGNTVSASLVSSSSTGTQTLCSGSSAGSGVQQAVTFACPAHVITGDEQLVLVFSPLRPTSPPTFASASSVLYGAWVQAAPATVRTIIVPAVPARPNSGGNNSAFLVGPTDTWGLSLRVGERIVGARAFTVLDGGSPQWRLDLMGNTEGSALVTPLASSAIDATGGGVLSTISLSCSLAVLAGWRYALNLQQIAAGNGIGGPMVQGLELDVTD